MLSARIGAAPLPQCARGNEPLEYLGAGSDAKPFWSMAHVFFAFPFKGAGIAALGFLALTGFFYS